MAANVYGTNGPDLLEVPYATETVFGLGGDDTLDGDGVAEEAKLVGGSGNDTYRMRGDDLVDIYDTGGIDRLSAPGINLSRNGFIATADGGRHLALLDADSQQVVSVFGWQDDVSRIEWYDLGDRTYSAGQIKDIVEGGGDRYLFDLSWEEGTNGTVTTFQARLEVEMYFEVASLIESAGPPTDGDDAVLGTPASETLAGGAGSDAMMLNLGDDSAWGESGNDSIYGDGGNDFLAGNTGDDYLYGSDGNDLMRGHVGEDTLFGDTGNDTAYGGGGDDIIWGYLGSDILNGNAGHDQIDGGPAMDILRGQGGPDLLWGGAGNDDLLGMHGVDTLYGGEGDDQIIGGEAVDFLYGGAGRDTFTFGVGHGSDIIEDFEDGVDRIRLYGATFADITISDWSRGAEITFADLVIRIRGISADLLGAEDFNFI